MILLETDNSSPTYNISGAIAIGSYTADVNRRISVRVRSTAAGNGDYTIYLTIQYGGSGAEYRMLPITTAEAASGVTAIAFPSINIDLLAGDVVRVYLTSLAGDTAVTTKVEWFDAASVDARRWAGVDTATDDLVLLSSAQLHAALLATAISGGDVGDALERILAYLDASVSSITAAVTLGVTSITNNVQGSTVTTRRGDKVDLTLTTNSFVFNTGDKLDLILKPINTYKDVDDADADLWIRKTGGGNASDGLQVLNGAPQSGAALAKASLAQTASTSVRVIVNGDIYAQIDPDKFRFEVQHTPTGTSDPITVAEGDWITNADVVRATS